MPYSEISHRSCNRQCDVLRGTRTWLYKRQIATRGTDTGDRSLRFPWNIKVRLTVSLTLPPPIAVMHSRGCYKDECTAAPLSPLVIATFLEQGKKPSKRIGLSSKTGTTDGQKPACAPCNLKLLVGMMCQGKANGRDFITFRLILLFPLSEKQTPLNAETTPMSREGPVLFEILVPLIRLKTINQTPTCNPSLFALLCVRQIRQRYIARPVPLRKIFASHKEQARIHQVSNLKTSG